MGVLIKGMEMPKAEFGSMIVAIHPDGMVEDVMGCYVGKAVPVPPHGRLIDADLFSKVLKGRAAEEWNQHISPLSWSYAYECLNDTLDSMPTIIEEEE